MEFICTNTKLIIAAPHRQLQGNKQKLAISDEKHINNKQATVPNH